jgi:hypothetical protein
MNNTEKPEEKAPETQQKKNTDPAKNPKQRKAPKAAIVWLVILLCLGGLLLFRDSGASRKTDLNQTEFEQSLAAGKIVSAVLGHSNVGITLDIYSHPNVAMQNACLDAMRRNNKKTE